jgi:hypothetical protein
MVTYNKRRPDVKIAIMQVVQQLTSKCGHNGESLSTGNGTPTVARRDIHLVLDYNGTFDKGSHDGIVLSNGINELVHDGMLLKHMVGKRVRVQLA